jgi:hypothetical protein
MEKFNQELTAIAPSFGMPALDVRSARIRAAAAAGAAEATCRGTDAWRPLMS